MSRSCHNLFECRSYTPPSWANHLIPLPESRITLSTLPSPIHTWKPIDDTSIKFNFLIKRDDLSSFELSGNKVRKLEFLLADAIKKGHDCVVTIGGIQSNHARATAVAARQLGLDSYLILRTKDPESDPGLVGNLLLDRLVGANLRLVSPGTYAQIGQYNLINQLIVELRSSGRNPYAIPVGGSNGLGTWGYLEGVSELLTQLQETGQHIDHIVFACGSGGTACGISLAIRLSGASIKVHAMAVCDNAEYFYNHMELVAQEMGVDLEKYGPVKDWCQIHPAQGIGYARSTTEELEFISDISRRTGIILDPVYSGKAFCYFMKAVTRSTKSTLSDSTGSSPSIEINDGETVLFLHTGGIFGLYEKEAQLLPILSSYSDISKMKVSPP